MEFGKRSILSLMITREGKMKLWKKPAMSKKLLAVFAISTMCTVGCVTAKQWNATGGSRADGTVKLSFQYGSFEAPRVSAQQGIEVAISRCSAWGYSGAEAFGGVTKICASASSSGCDLWTVTQDYQCTGRPEK